MALPYEFSTIIVSKDTIEKYFSGGMDAYFDFCESPNFLEDDYITKVSYMATDESANLVAKLGEKMSGVEDDYQTAIIDSQIIQSELPDWLELAKFDGIHGIKSKNDNSGKFILPPSLLFCN